MAFTVATSIDGECVCSVCCRQVWTSVWDCDTSTWSAPAYSSGTLVAGPCPADIPWEYDGGTLDPCDAVYIKFVAVADVCKDCDSVAQIPPAGPMLAEPSGCCEDVCIYIWQSNPDCTPDEWLPSTIISVICDSPGLVPGVKNTWFVQNPGECPIYIQVTATACEDMEDCPSEPASPPTPPVPPELPSFYEGCCQKVCWVRWDAVPDCVNDEWLPSVVGAFDCQVPGFYPPGWQVDGFGFDFCPHFWKEQVTPCDGILDCEEEGTPPDPAVPATPPSAWADCCACCYYCYVAEYDCISETWDVTLVDSLCETCGSENPCGYPEGSLAGWVVDPEDNCVYFRTMSFGLCNDVSECDFPPDPGTPGGAPSGCCENCCRKVYTSTYDCVSAAWGEVTWVSTTNDVACASDVDWEIGAEPCVATYIAYFPMGSEECGSPEIGAPEVPGFVPPNCCTCCFVDYRAFYDCETGEWSDGVVFGEQFDQPCLPDTGWIKSDLGDCAAYRHIYFSDPAECEDPEEEIPGPGGGPGENCCDDPCCETVWSSTYDCPTDLWSDPVIISQTPDTSCNGSTDWEVDTGFGPCVATRTTSTQPGDCSGVSTISSPGGFPPDCCGEPCEDCTDTQGSATVSGFTGDCAYLNGSYPFAGYFADGDACTWFWFLEDGMTVDYNYLGSGVFGFNAPWVDFATLDDSNLACAGGQITGVVTGTTPGWFDCPGQSFTVVFG